MGTLWTLQSSHPGLSLYSAQPLAYGTAYYTLSLGVNIILTVLIIARLLMYRRTHLAHLPPQHAQQYFSIATLIIESAALYSIFAVAFLVSYAMNQPINQVFLGCASAAQVRFMLISPAPAVPLIHGLQQIATYLIIYRVADGTAWTKETMQSRTLTSLHARAGGLGHEKSHHDPTGVQFTSQLSVSDFVESKVAGVETRGVAA